MKYSVKLLLWEHNPNKYDQYPIYLRITVNRKTKYVSTGHYINKTLWDAENQRVKVKHTDAATINADITEKKSKALKQIVSTTMAGNIVSSDQVKQQFEAEVSANYFQFVDEYKQEMEKKREGGTTENYRKHAKKLEDFHRSRNLVFEEITPKYLAEFEKYLFSEPKRGGKEGETVGVNYAYIVIRSIRTMFNAARKRGITNTYPFTVYELPRYVAPEKDVLTLKELDKLEKVSDTTNNHRWKQACIYFLLGAYTGLRVGDWYKFDINKHVVKNEVILRATKNKEWIAIEVHARLSRNLQRISDNPLTIYEQDINEELAAICKANGIKKKITTHSGRHTFAVTMCAERGVSCETCATLMGITFETCAENYYRVTKEKIKSETKKAWTDL